jgi:hypothetical protein
MANERTSYGRCRDELEAARQRALDLEDRLDDIVSGLRHWYRTHADGVEWSIEDEALYRWVEYIERGLLGG